MSSLKKIYVAQNAVDAHMLKGLLDQEGIEAVVRGDDFVPFQGGTLFRMEIRPSVWVLDDERLPRARELADDFQRRDVPPPLCSHDGPWNGNLDRLLWLRDMR